MPTITPEQKVIKSSFYCQTVLIEKANNRLDFKFYSFKTFSSRKVEEKQSNFHMVSYQKIVANEQKFGKVYKFKLNPIFVPSFNFLAQVVCLEKKFLKFSQSISWKSFHFIIVKF